MRGFSPKHLCLRQLFNRATERAIRTQLESLLELEHLAKLDKAADAADGKVLTEDPLTLFSHIAVFLPHKKNLQT